METIAKLTQRNARSGLVCWCGLRPARRKPLISVDEIDITLDGINGDHYQSGGKRSVTLMQHEHLQTIASFLGTHNVNPAELRRNITVSGINLLGLRNRQFKMGGAILMGTGICAPCSRMEEILGPGGYTAVRGHGGITAKVIVAGKVAIGDTVSAV